MVRIISTIMLAVFVDGVNTLSFHRRAAPRLTTRRNELATAAATIAATIWLTPPALAQESGTVREGIAKAASAIPGYGQPDIFYPDYFHGRWSCERQLVGIAGDLEAAAVREDDLVLALAQESAMLLNVSLEHRCRFIEHDGRVVADRGFNELNRERARSAGLKGVPTESLSGADDSERSSPSLGVKKPVGITWDADNANVVTMAYDNGSLMEIKTTKRSFEEPPPSTTEATSSQLATSPPPSFFGTSEYQRLAVSGSAGLQASVPKLGAARTLVRFRKVPIATAGLGSSGSGSSAGNTNSADYRIEGLELVKLYPPVTIQQDQPPCLTLKSRIVFTREV